jgi:short-subunit dehydrogenase
MPNLTKKFSRDSLRRATRIAQVSKAKMKRIEEEIARAAEKEDNALICTSFSGQLDTSPSNVSEMSYGANSISNAQILHAMSSLTEDRFYNGAGDDADPGRDGPPLVVARMIAQSGSFAPSLSRPIMNSLTEAPILEEVDSSSKGSLISNPTLSKASTLNRSLALDPTISKASTESFYIREPTESGRQITSSSRDLSRPGHPNGRQDRQQTPPRSSGSSTYSHRTSPGRLLSGTSSLKGRGLGASRRFANNPMSRAIKNEEMTQRLEQEKQRCPPTSTSQSDGSRKLLYQLCTSIFKLVLNILLLPKTLFCYIFQRTAWSPTDRTILITGASSGIGAELARQYAIAGAQVALLARTEEDLERVAKECRDLGASKTKCYTADLRNLTSIQTAMKLALSDFGNFEVVVLNAGRCQGCYFEEIKDVRQIEQLIRLNVTGAMSTLHYLLPHMPKSKDSRIVFMSHTAGIVATPYQSIFSASKHALTGFANSLRMELNNTYREEAPKVCLVSLPDITGTKINASRMDMGARLPAARCYSWAGIPLSMAVHDLLPAIAAGRREYGQTKKFNIWRLLYPICPNLVDKWMLKHVQSTHYRPRPTPTTTDSSSKNNNNAKQSTAINEGNPELMSKSWAG